MRILSELSAWYPHYTTSSLGLILEQLKPIFKRNNIHMDICSPAGGDINVMNPQLVRYFRKNKFFYHFIRRIYFWEKAYRYTIRNIENYDLFWIHNPNPFIWRKINSKFLNKIIITQHCTFYGVSKTSPYNGMIPKIYFHFMSKLEKQFIKNIRVTTNEIIAISPTIKKELEELGVDEKNVLYIPNGVDIHKFRPASIPERKEFRKKIGIPEDSIIFLTVGQLIESKHPINLIKTFKNLSKKFTNVYLIIIGKGEMKTQIDTIITNFPNVFLIEFLPFSEINEYYNCADYYITASTYEGQSLALLEAMSSGLPCITSNISTFNSIIRKANCGITLNFDSSDLSNKILIDFFKNHDKQKLGENAREFVKKYHSWDKISKEYIKLFERIIR